MGGFSVLYFERISFFPPELIHSSSVISTRSGSESASGWILSLEEREAGIRREQDAGAAQWIALGCRSTYQHVFDEMGGNWRTRSKGRTCGTRQKEKPELRVEAGDSGAARHLLYR